MKKTAKITVAAILAALALTSCANPNLPSLNPKDTTAAVTTEPADTLPSVDDGTEEGTSTVEVYSGLLLENGRYDLTATDLVTFTKDMIEGVKLPAEVHTPTEETLTLTLASVLCEFADSTVHLDREIKLGDTVNIDYVGSIDGVEFAGGSTQGSGTDVTVGVTSYIDDFLYQLIGHKAGETINIEVTFPEDYGNEELNGKDAVFVTKINYVLKTPELTDEFVSTSLADYGCTTAEEFMNFVTDSLTTEAIDNFIYAYLADGFEVKEIPEELIEKQTEQMLNYYNDYAVSYGLDLDTFLTYYVGTTKEQLISDSRAQCEELAKRTLVCQAIAETIGYEPSETDLLAYFGENYGVTDLTEFKEYYGAPYLKQIVTERHIIDYIVENAVKE